MKEIIVIFYVSCFLVNSIAIAKDYRSHVNWPKDMEEVCGESNSDRIIGGEEAKLGQFPWMAQLAFRRYTNCIINK